MPAFAQASQDALTTAGPQAAHVLDLWRYSLLLCTAVFAGIVVACLWAVWRAPRAGVDTPAESRPSPARDARAKRIVLVAVGLSTLGLFSLVLASVQTDRVLAQLPLKDALHIELTGQQWWWQARYDDADPSRIFITANELHVPVGRPVILTLNSSDVIHSLWLPNVAGKKDLIPGRQAQHAFRVDVPGTYRGPCAEFCGAQHARMALLLVAEPADRYEAWAAKQREPASVPKRGPELEGQQLFLGTTCGMCHTVVGTGANGQHAPDLTHLGSRSTIASGVLPNDREHLASWITDPQAHKPGSNMPAHAFTGEQLSALVAYLQSLR